MFLIPFLHSSINESSGVESSKDAMDNKDCIARRDKNPSPLTLVGLAINNGD